MSFSSPSSVSTRIDICTCTFSWPSYGVSGLVGGIALLKTVGFVKDETHLELTLAVRDSNKALLEETLAKLEKAHAAYVAGAC